MFRALTRFAIVVLIGVGATLGWQAYGDMAKEMLAVRAPELAWVLSYLPATKPPAAVAAAPSPVLQLEPLASNLEYVRRSVEQLALKQEQMLRNIAALQALDEDIRQKVSAPPPPTPSAAAAQAAMPQPKPAPPKLQPPPARRLARRRSLHRCRLQDRANLQGTAAGSDGRCDLRSVTSASTTVISMKATDAPNTHCGMCWSMMKP
jgi:hypothetical protein